MTPCVHSLGHLNREGRDIPCVHLPLHNHDEDSILIQCFLPSRQAGTLMCSCFSYNYEFNKCNNTKFNTYLARISKILVFKFKYRQCLASMIYAPG